jgi:hypothetical protein
VPTRAALLPIIRLPLGDTVVTRSTVRGTQQGELMGLNRLRGVLDLVFPELLGIFRLLGKPTVLTVLLSYPTAAALAAADL